MKVLQFFGKTATTIFVLMLLLTPAFCFIFAGSLVVAFICWFGFSVPFALTYLSIAWKIHLVIALLSFVFLLTFSFQHCCVGMDTFPNHLKYHVHKRELALTVLNALVWPVYLLRVHSVMKGWYSSLPDEIFKAICFLASSFKNKGTAVTVVDLRTGEEVTVYAKTPEEAREILLTSAVHFSE